MCENFMNTIFCTPVKKKNFVEKSIFSKYNINGKFVLRFSLFIRFGIHRYHGVLTKSPATCDYIHVHNDFTLN